MTVRTAGAEELCAHCALVPADFADDLGHDHLGHYAVGVLRRGGIDTRARLAQATDAELMLVRNLGPQARARVRQAFPAPQPTQRPAGYSPRALLDRLPASVDVPHWMLTDSAAAASLWILTAISRTDKRIWQHLTHRMIKYADIVREGGWSPSELALLHAARCLAGQAQIGPNLDELAASLDETRWDALLEALRIRRTGLRGSS